MKLTKQQIIDQLRHTYNECMRDKSNIHHADAKYIHAYVFGRLSECVKSILDEVKKEQEKQVVTTGSCLDCEMKCKPVIKLFGHMDKDPWSTTKTLDFFYKICKGV